MWGNQAAHASVAGVLPGPRFWGDIVDACELLVDHRVDNPLYDPGRGTRLPQRCRLAVCGSCGHISARIRHCPTLFGTPLAGRSRASDGTFAVPSGGGASGFGLVALKPVSGACAMKSLQKGLACSTGSTLASIHWESRNPAHHIADS